MKLVEKGELAVVTCYNKPVAYMISAERIEAMQETMEVLASPEFMRALWQRIAEARLLIVLSIQSPKIDRRVFGHGIRSAGIAVGRKARSLRY